MEGALPAESLNCPNCGAPLRQPAEGETAFCMYCNSLIRFGAAKPSKKASLDEGEMNSIKQLIASGQRTEAVERFQELSRLDSQQAQHTIDEMAEAFTIKTVFNQQLTRAGMAQVVLSVILLPFSLLAYQTGLISPWVTLIIVGLAGFTLYAFGRGAITTLRYWKAPVAKATTLNFTQVGEVQRGRLRVRNFLFLLKVQPENGEPFMARAIIPVREDNVKSIKPGGVISVKYLPDQPDSVIFNQY
jgi:uncharacterized Zn finger protein (UPF0148 family)